VVGLNFVAKNGTIARILSFFIMEVSASGTEVAIETGADEEIVEMIQKFRTAHPDETSPDDFFELIAQKYQTTVEHVRELAAQQESTDVEKPTPASEKKSPQSTLENFAQGVAATIAAWKRDEREEPLEVRDAQGGRKFGNR